MKEMNNYFNIIYYYDWGPTIKVIVVQLREQT